MGLMTLAGAAFAQTAALTTTSFAPGIPQARSANYLVDGALDPSGGVIAISENYVLKPGYIGQLHDPVSLAVAPRFATVDEGASNQFDAVATMDDGSTLPLAAADMAWSILSGPLESISTAGIAQTTVVFMDTPATIRGEFASLSDAAVFTVLDSTPDNFGPVAGDGLDDDWQFEFFDEDDNGSLDPGEASNAGPDSDPDHDRQNNQFEALAGYDPTDPLSFFSFAIDGKSGATADLRLSKVIAGTRYRVQRSLDFGQLDPFATFETLVPVDEQLDQVVIDPAAAESGASYRVILDQAP